MILASEMYLTDVWSESEITNFKYLTLLSMLVLDLVSVCTPGLEIAQTGRVNWRLLAILRKVFKGFTSSAFRSLRLLGMLMDDASPVIVPASLQVLPYP